MRRLLLVVALFAAWSSFAQESPLRVSVYASDVFGSDAMGVGAALEYRFNRHWAAELGAASEKHTVGFSLFSDSTREITTHPVDLTVHYYFVNQTRWQPFIGGGVHYINSNDPGADGRAAAEFDGGFHFMITPSFSIRVDGRATYQNWWQSYDSVFKMSGGVGWKF